MNLGERIYRLRTERNMSQGDLAEALEVSRQSVSKWENNSAVPELDKLVRMHEIFGVTLDELVLEEKPQPEAGAEVPEPEVRTVYVERNGSARKTVGTILLCFAGMVFLVLAFLAGILGALCIALPFAVCGVICLTAKKCPGLWCAWTVYLWIDVYLRVATGVSWQYPIWWIWKQGLSAQSIVALCELAVLVVLVVITVRCLSGTPLAPTKKRLLLAVVLWLLFALSWIPMGIAVTEPEMIRKVAWFNACKGWVRNILLIGTTAHTARLIKGRNRKS